MICQARAKITIACHTAHQVILSFAKISIFFARWISWTISWEIFTNKELRRETSSFRNSERVKLDSFSGRGPMVWFLMGCLEGSQFSYQKLIFSPSPRSHMLHFLQFSHLIFMFLQILLFNLRCLSGVRRSKFLVYFWVRTLAQSAPGFLYSLLASLMMRAKFLVVLF